MKRTMKKLVALALSVVMMLAMTITASAASVTLSDPDNLLTNHTFKAYQIFSGTQAEGSAVLGDIEWGTGINSAAFLKALKDDTVFDATFDNCTTAKDVANVIKTFGEDSEQARRVAMIAQKYTQGDGVALTPNEAKDLPSGYYLIVDTTVPGEGQVNNGALLQITNNDIVIKAKVEKPTVDKKVDDSGNLDFEIGDEVPFKITSTVPDTTQYDYYYYEFKDTMSDGLTLDNSTISVKIGAKTYTTETNDSHVIITPATDGHGLNVKIIIKDENGTYFADNEEIEITYKATLNENAVIATNPNTNKVTLDYSNNPNDKEDYDSTPEVEVDVYTFEVNINKVDEEEKPLSGAEFALFANQQDAAAAAADPSEENLSKALKFNQEGTKYILDAEQDGGTTTLSVDEKGKLSIDGLDQGTYYLVETKAPAGYNRLTTVTNIEISATYNEGKCVSYTVNKDDNHTITVKNNKGTTLPETGGMGTTILYMAGILVMATAVFYFVMGKKRREQ